MRTSSSSLDSGHCEVPPPPASPPPDMWPPPSPHLAARPGRPPPTLPPRRVHCDMCAWRNRYLPDPGETADEWHEPLHQLERSGRSDKNIAITFAMHTQLPPLWKDICRTETLQAGLPLLLPGDHRRWFRFPLRKMQPMSQRPSSHFQTPTEFVMAYEGHRVDPDAQGKFTMYHYCKLINLVQPHENSRGSSGILRDGGMRNGGWHGDGIGVYCHATPPHRYFSEGDGWVMLELRCHGHLTKVKGGALGRYVIKSDQTDQSLNAHCTDCEVVAIIHFYNGIPEFAKF